MNAYEIFIKIKLNLQHLQIDVHALTGNFDMFSHFRGDPKTPWQIFWTLYKRCGIAIWCERGFKK